MKCAMSLFQRTSLASIVDITNFFTCILWLIPFLNGDRDVVPNNHSALIYKYSRVLFWSNRFAIFIDFVDA